MREQPISSYAAGGYDWLATWRRMYDEERAQAEQATPPDFSVGADFWAGQAGRFATAASQVPQPDSFMQFLLPQLRPTDRLLDIGAGTGRYEPALARAVAELLALEPSPAMREQLEQRIAEEQLGQVRVIAEGWPEAAVPPCDVAIAAHVLYGVREVGPFLRGMDAVARRACFLLLGYQHPASFISPFWERLHGAPRLPLPCALECLNALYQLGIPAQLALVPVARRFSYASEEAALIDIRWRLRQPPEPQRDAIIRDAIRDLMDRDAEGRLLPRGLPEQMAVIWWARRPPGAVAGA
ncbi:MAG: class I SAM-dependent methyltransferase [Roseiflexaceae bacterium]